MPAIKYKVNLTDEEKLQLEALLHKGKSAARSQIRARMLLKAAAGVQDKAISRHWTSRRLWWQKSASGVWKKGLKRRSKIVLDPARRPS